MELRTHLSFALGEDGFGRDLLADGDLYIAVPPHTRIAHALSTRVDLGRSVLPTGNGLQSRPLDGVRFVACYHTRYDPASRRRMILFPPVRIRPISRASLALVGFSSATAA